MALTHQPGVTTSIKAASPVLKHRFISFTGGYPSVNAKALGVSMADTDAGKMIPVVVTGIAIVEAGGAVSKGDALTTDAEGKAVKADPFSVTVPAGATSVTSDAAQPDLVESGGVLPQAVNGYALDDAASAGDLIRILLA
jgi:hypothetical protein